MNLHNIRDEIDAIDRRIIALLSARFEKTNAVADFKKESGKAVFDAKRETELFAKIERHARKKNLSIRVARSVFQEIVHESRRAQEARIHHP